MKTGAADAFSLIQSSFLLVIDGLVVDVLDCHVHDLVLLRELDMPLLIIGKPDDPLIALQDDLRRIEYGVLISHEEYEGKPSVLVQSRLCITNKKNHRLQII